MSQITDQQTTDAQFGAATTLWDPELSWASQRAPGDTLDNQGCPPGYATIYGTSGKFCRLVSTASAVQIQQDTAPGFLDQSTISVAAAAQALVSGAQQAGGAAAGALGWTLSQVSTSIATILGPLAPWLIGGGLLYLWSIGAFEAGREAVGVARARVRTYAPPARGRVSSKRRSR